MKLMAKSLKPSKGNIAYNGVDIYSQDNILADFGIMIDPVFYPDMTVMENVKFYLRLHDKENMFFNIEPTLKLVELWDERNRKPRDFSFG
ncbi:ABC transporter ATP-binding protein, partial [Streptococcus pyogenes]